MDDELYTDDPFSISPDPLFLYLTPSIKATIHKVRYTINRRQGLTAILGDVGMGKSTIVRYLYTQFDARDEVEARMIPTPKFSSDFAFVKGVCSEFDIPFKRSILDQETALQAYLVEQFQAGRNVVLFLDEAQKLSNKMLEIVRSMLNFETNSAKLIQIVLSGQLELHNRLMRDDMEAITSRIVMPSILTTLSPAEAREMLEFRCEKAEIPFPFTPAALQLVYDHTQGTPRELLKISGTAYEYMRMTEASDVDEGMMEVAIREGTLKQKKAATNG